MEDPRIFFSTKKAEVEKAKAMCRRCPMAESCLINCLEFEALSGEPRLGIYGATTPDERIQLTSRGQR
jgi:hypothetical protein